MKRVICKLEEYTNYKIKFRYLWRARKLRSLFPLKGPIFHKANVFTREHVHAKNSILEKQNVTRKFNRTNIALLRETLK